MSKIGIKFNQGGKIYNVDVSDLSLNINDKVVVESVRGLEIAIVSPLSKQETDDEIKAVIRKATDEDLNKYEELKTKEKNIINITKELIKKYKLEMKIVDVSFTLDGSKVIINYVCEDRVDFRELVKDLASQLKLRIELRQIGIRDQAKKLGGIGFCGKECCCKKYLNDFDKVSIKMAKTQGLSLNPSKISGICGRLMCCLAYENEFYSEVAGKMPKINSKVVTPDGEGVVIYNNLLKQVSTVKIEKDNDVKINEYTVDKLTIIPKETQQSAVNSKLSHKEPNSNMIDDSEIEQENIRIPEKQKTKNKIKKFKKKNKNEIKK